MMVKNNSGVEIEKELQEKKQEATRPNPEQYGKVAVLYGGLSAEREISLQSGDAVTRGLLNRGVDAVGIDVNQHVVEQLKSVSPDRVFIALHGPGGEDGRIQAVLDWLEIPYTGSDFYSSAIGMNKLRTKQIWSLLDIPTPEYVVLEKDTSWKTVKSMLGGEIFIKPVLEGSSIGMSFVSEEKAFESAVVKARRYKGEILAEKRICGNEYTVAILNGLALPPIKLKTNRRFYDYEAKYESNETEYCCPCGLADAERSVIEQLALKGFSSLGCSGWGRVDLMQDKAGNFYLLEVNTVPGMTNHSLVPMAAKAAGMSFDDLVIEILSQA